jgi:hypothetical protein
MAFAGRSTGGSSSTKQMFDWVNEIFKFYEGYKLSNMNDCWKSGYKNGNSQVNKLINSYLVECIFCLSCIDTIKTKWIGLHWIAIIPLRI